MFFRISRNSMFMSFATIVAQRSTCLRLRVGSVLVLDSRVISMGYAGAPSGQAHCNPDNCSPNKPCLRTIHAEQNTVAFAAKTGISVNGSTLYTTHQPCLSCAKLMWNSGIKDIVYDTPYRDRAGLEFFLEVGGSIMAFGDLQESPIRI